jgi:hypothetical protein
VKVLWPFIDDRRQRRLFNAAAVAVADRRQCKRFPIEQEVRYRQLRKLISRPQLLFS